MPILNRGKRGIEIRDQRLVLRDAITDPTLTGPVMFEDYIAPIGATLADSSRVSIAQSGTPSAAAAISGTAGAPTAGHGGWLSGSVDNVDDEIDEVALGDAGWLVPAALPAGGMIVAEFGLVAPAVTARILFCGLSDVVTGGADDDGPLSIATGITLVSGATGDAAGFVMSSLATDADAWYTGAVKATSVGTAYNTTAGTGGGATLNPAAADDYTKLRLEVDSAGDIWFYGNVSLTGQREIRPLFVQNQTAAITATAVLLPSMTTASTATTAVVWEHDYIFGAAAQ